MQRKGGNVTWGEVKNSFAQLYSTGRGHRVGAWQNLLFYVSDAQDNSSVSALSGTKARQSNKCAYDAMRGEQIAFRDADAGSEDIEQLRVDDKVKFKSTDQYVGINDVPFDGVDCVLFNWASTPKSGKLNVAMATLANKETGDVITKGRALEGNNAAHNLCVVTDKG